MTVPISTAYTTFGTPTPDGKERLTATSTWLEQSRTAFMDKCIDWETAPFTGMEEYQLYDVSARKYQAATGTFITPDPLWVVSPGSGSYTYANHDPINLIDPSGLAPEGSGQPLTEDGTEVVAGRPTITKTEPDPGIVKEPENKDGIVSGSGEPGNAPAPTNKPIGKQSQEFLDNYAAVNAIHAEWDADHKGIGAEQGNPGDCNTDGQGYGEEKGLPKRDKTSTTTQSGPKGQIPYSSDSDNWAENAGVAFDLTWNWLTGSSGSPVFMNGPVADALRNATQVNQAKDYFYKKYQGKDNLSDASVQNYKGKFGLQGLLGAGIDPIEQFIGSYRIDIYASNADLLFVITNTTSMKSLL